VCEADEQWVFCAITETLALHGVTLVVFTVHGRAAAVHSVLLLFDQGKRWLRRYRAIGVVTDVHTADDNCVLSTCGVAAAAADVGRKAARVVGFATACKFAAGGVVYASSNAR
jgi:hypothetical protein